MIAILLLTTLSFLIAETRSRNDVEDDYQAPFLPTNPMIVQMNNDHLDESDLPRIQYKGCHKFCVGTVRGSPGSDSVWNPYNLSGDEIYFFRYVKVNMRECGWPADKSDQVQMMGLFFDDEEEEQGYVISRPADQITWHSFYFLIYNPDNKPDEDFKVRWTSYMNVCDNDESDAPVFSHFETNAFDPTDYISVFQDHEEMDP